MPRRHIPALCLCLLAAPRLHAQAAPAPIPLAIAPQPAAPKPEEAVAALRAAIDTLEQQRKDHQQFLYTLEMDETFSSPDGRIIGTESMKFENIFIEGKPYSRLIEKNGKPLTKKEAAAEEKKYNQALASHNSFTTTDHFSHAVHGVYYDMKDVQSSYTLRYVGWQIINGRRLWRIEALPPPTADGKPSIHQVKVVFWLDEQTKAIVRDDSTLYQSDDQLLVGSHDSETYIQVDGIYCKAGVSSHLVLLNNSVIDSDHIFTNYKKFTTTIKIIPDQ